MLHPLLRWRIVPDQSEIGVIATGRKQSGTFPGWETSFFAKAPGVQFSRRENWWQGPESNRLLGFARKSVHIEG
jgi:hypothetical protein